MQLRRNEIVHIGTPGLGTTEYPDNADCTWTITADHTSHIAASFVRFDLEDGCFDSVTLTSDGETNLVSRSCGRKIFLRIPKLKISSVSEPGKAKISHKRETSVNLS